MKSFYQIVCAVSLVFLLLGCQQQPPVFTDAEKATISKEVKEQVAQMVAVVNQMNAGAWSKYYSEKEFVSAIARTDYYANRKEWVDFITKQFSLRERQNIELSAVRVTAIAPNLALMTSEGKAGMMLKDGKQMKFKHVFTMIWKKEQAGWKIMHSHESWMETPAEKPVAEEPAK
jgi:ketosteroid isomerase-like protein